ncbi:hypothetical protein BRADI_2g02910v3 [Brachypodium distachyon]|uniref:F-box domain-containing protein n=1 Tax=Brachypodium distachyon TaxID=15368 RepID=A0A0Q3FWT3_BRADI|nr:hypothetical protein BRADI_2g02910v3 [Brachypodium distachyon]
MSEEGGGTTHRRGSSPPAAPASLPDDDDLLREILLRLPPQPSSLPRASAVCKRWRAVATDPKFLQCFRTHHRKPPLLGYRNEVAVCDPISGEQRRVAVPPEFRIGFLNGAVLCAAGDQGHVHGGCHSCPFKVVLLSMPEEGNRPLACVYSSETGIWGDLISTAAPCELDDSSCPSTLVGNALYWLDESNGMLEFDLDGQGLSMITGPAPITDDFCHENIQIIQAEDGVVGLAVFSYPSIQIWHRKTVDMHNILGLPPQLDEWETGLEAILGYAEDTDDILIYVRSNVYMVQLKSMQSKRLHETHHFMDYHPFKSFYTPAIGTHA